MVCSGGSLVGIDPWSSQRTICSVRDSDGDQQHARKVSSLHINRKRFEEFMFEHRPKNNWGRSAYLAYRKPGFTPWSYNP